MFASRNCVPPLNPEAFWKNFLHFKSVFKSVEIGAEDVRYIEIPEATRSPVVFRSYFYILQSRPHRS